MHLKGMSEETCLIPATENARPVAKSFGSTTEFFFLTHRALDLGYRVVLDKLLRFVVFAIKMLIVRVTSLAK